MAMIPWWLIVLGAMFCLAVGFFAPIAGEWVWKRIRASQSNWPPSEPLQRRSDDSWQARHRSAYDQGRRTPARHRVGGVGIARIRRARIKTKRGNN